MEAAITAYLQLLDLSKDLFGEKGESEKARKKKKNGRERAERETERETHSDPSTKYAL